MALRARKPVNLTLGLCIAGGLAAGVALARPASSDSGSDTGESSTTATAAAEEQTSDRYQYPSVADDAEEVQNAPAASANSITIADFAFGAPITVAPGAEIVVTNVDTAPHSVTADVGFDSGVLDSDAEATIVAPDSPGSYTFICLIHPSMQGELVVG